MHDKIKEILQDTLDTSGNDAIFGHDTCATQLVQLMANKCAEVAEWQYLSGESYRNTLIKCGFSEDQARIAVGHLR